MRTTTRKALVATILFGPVLAMAEGTKTEADNTARNKADQSEMSLTADQQSNKKSDLEITRKIRQELVENKNLSTYAQNVKIITRNGQVTLRGPVRSSSEKAETERIAKAVAGATAVQNELTIAQ